MRKKTLKNLTKSFYIIARDRNLEEAMYKDLKKIQLLIREIHPARRWGILTLKKNLADLIGECCESDPKLLGLFIEEMIKKDLSRHIDEIITLYKNLLYESKGFQIVNVETAFPLSDEEKKLIEKRLKEILKKDILCDYAVDKRLIGGIRIKIGELYLDLSIKNKLDKLRSSILKGVQSCQTQTLL